jgi:hypothetical protein
MVWQVAGASIAQSFASSLLSGSGGGGGGLLGGGAPSGPAISSAHGELNSGDFVINAGTGAGGGLLPLISLGVGALGLFLALRR